MEDELYTTLKNLVEKLGEVEPGMINAFTIAALHGNNYDGPNYEEELKKAKEVLSKKESGE